MSENSSYSGESNSNQLPSFFKNSCTGADSVHGKADLHLAADLHSEDDALSEGPSDLIKRKGGPGGYTCCVPECFSNSKRDPSLSFYSFPDGKLEDKVLLRKRWLHLVGRKEVRPTHGHRVCLKHFLGGKKTYMNNLPMITPKTAKAKPVVPRQTTKARNRTVPTITTGPVQEDVLQEEITDGHTVNNSEELETRLQFLENENRMLKEENERLKSENACLLEKVSDSQKKPSFCFKDVKDNDKLVNFYTGLPDYLTLNVLFKSFGNAGNKLVYYDSGTNSEKLSNSEHNKCGPKRSLTPEQEFFLVLVRLRLGLLEEDLAYRASISAIHISRILVTWIDFLHNFFRAIPIWGSRACINEAMPGCFKDSYPTTRVIIDCTELFIEKASSVRSQSATFSHYKQYNTAKGVVGISPSGIISFVSDLYAGRTSDKQATVDCGILTLLDSGDSIMADRGFEIDHSLLPTGVTTVSKRQGRPDYR